MFDNLKNKIENMKAEAKKKEEEKRIEAEKRKEELKRKEEERRAEIRRKNEERERLEREKIEKEKERLMALDEKELLIEMMFMLKEIAKEQKMLKDQVEDCERDVCSNQTAISLLDNKILELSSDVDFLKYNS